MRNLFSFEKKSPTDLLHSSPAPHLNTSQIFLIPFPKCPRFFTIRSFAPNVALHYFPPPLNLSPIIVRRFFLSLILFCHHKMVPKKTLIAHNMRLKYMQSRSLDLCSATVLTFEGRTQNLFYLKTQFVPRSKHSPYWLQNQSSTILYGDINKCRKNVEFCYVDRASLYNLVNRTNLV